MVQVLPLDLKALQGLGADARERAHYAALEIYGFARKFADKVGDQRFEQRLALGLARSFATSTRFIMDKQVARNMIMRACYLMHWFLDFDKDGRNEAGLPVEEIFIG